MLKIISVGREAVFFIHFKGGIAMFRSDIPKVLFSCIREDDPYRASKVFQIERWCYANWDLHERGGKKRHNFLAQVLSSEDCWKKVDGLHGVKLNRQMVGKRLIMPGSPFSNSRYDIACRCCLEEDIIALFEERKKRLSAQGKASLLEYSHLVRCFGVGPLGQFWSHFISGNISKLNLNGRHPYEYGLECAMGLKQAEAVEFFWNKIKSLPEDELSAQQKDEIFMRTAVRAAGSRCNYPEVFEFCFSQISTDKYPELLKRDLAENRYYGSLSSLREMRCFDHVQILFDCLKPCDISEDDYHVWLKCIEIKDCSEHHADAGIRLFMHMWMKEGFDSHRALVLKEEITVRSCFLVTGLLIPLIHRNYMEPVWAVLDKASPDQIKKFITSKQANYICSILKERGDEDSLNKFLLYGKSAAEELDKGNLSTDLAEVKLSKAMWLSK